MGWLIDLIPLPYTDAVVALGAAVLGLVAGVLGAFAVLRRRSLVGDALSHATLPGVCIAFMVTGTKDPTALLIGAGLAGLVGAALILGIERTGRIRSDAATGVVLSGFFATGIVLLTHIAQSGNANQAGLDRYLFGQAAGLQEDDIVVMTIIGAVGIAIVALLSRLLRTALFDREFAGAVGLRVRALDLGITGLLVIAIVVGVRVVGAILMVALLIVPTVTARQFTDRLTALIPLTGVIGAAVGVTGALLSMTAGVPTGPVIVVVGFVVAVLSIVLAPRRGVLRQAAARRRRHHRSLTQGLITDLAAVAPNEPAPTITDLAAASARSPRVVERAVRHLTSDGLVERSTGEIRLTEAGHDAAAALAQRRTLWALWLEHGAKLRLPDAREPDPHDVRGSMGDAVADELLRLSAERAQ